MVIERLELYNFRNIKDEQIDLVRGVNIFEGLNAQGKTNLLEGVYYCATGRSFRAAQTRALVMDGESASRILADVARPVSPGAPEGKVYRDRLEAVIDNKGKSFYIDGVKAAKLGDLFGRLYCVSFCPEDLRLVKAGPEYKRRFMDLELCQLDPVYYGELKAYYRALKHRNALLKSKAGADIEYLEPWDIQLAEYGERISKAREAYISRLYETTACVHGRLAGEDFSIAYRPNCPKGELLAKLRKHAARDAYMGTTTRGVHKDDLYMAIDGRDARVYASQGQARSAAVSIKLSQMDMYRAERRESPVMLLDDVFSELDATRQGRLIEALDDAQTIITCTGAETALKALGGNVGRFKVEGGVITGA